MNVTPPKTWGKIMGTVTGAGCAGTVPIAGAVVQIDTWAAHYTLLTDASGGYALWLDKRNNPLAGHRGQGRLAAEDAEGEDHGGGNHRRGLEPAADPGLLIRSR